MVWVGVACRGGMGKLAVSMRGMARLRRIAASGWAGGEWARAGWVDMLFSARMDAWTAASDLFSLLRIWVYEVKVFEHREKGDGAPCEG